MARTTTYNERLRQGQNIEDRLVRWLRSKGFEAWRREGPHHMLLDDGSKCAPPDIEGVTPCGRRFDLEAKYCEYFGWDIYGKGGYMISNPPWKALGYINYAKQFKVPGFIVALSPSFVPAPSEVKRCKIHGKPAPAQPHPSGLFVGSVNVLAPAEHVDSRKGDWWIGIRKLRRVTSFAEFEAALTGDRNGS